MFLRIFFTAIFIMFFAPWLFAAELQIDLSEKFPIGAWGGTFYIKADDAFYQDMAAAGFTEFVFEWGEMPDMDMANRHGLKLYMPLAKGIDWKTFDKELAKNKLQTLLKYINKHPGVKGIFIKDEPRAAEFAGLAEMFKLMKELCPELEGYVNLLPDCSAARRDCKNYSEYIDRFLKECNPAMFGYDHYIFCENESGIAESFWTHLELYGQFSRKYNKPFRYVLQAAGFCGCRVPNEAELRFQVFAAIAAGARCLEYFTYVTPDNGNYRMAPVDIFGNKTETWYAARRVNLVVQAWAPVLNHLRFQKSYHFPESDLHKLPAERAVKYINGTVFVGEFKHEQTNDTWLIVVNKDLKSSVYLDISSEIDKQLYRSLNAPPIKLVPFVSEQRWLAPGQGVLLKL